MADFSSDIDTAMLALLELCPQAMDDIGPRWVERTWAGEREASGEKDKIEGNVQTCIMESEDPERKKFEVGSTAIDVTGSRWEVEVETSRPEHSYETSDFVLTYRAF